jgi:hypothetical protein
LRIVSSDMAASSKSSDGMAGERIVMHGINLACCRSGSVQG